MKTERIGLIVTKEEKKWVIELARIEGGLSQASLIRRLIRKAAGQHRLSGIRERADDQQVDPIASEVCHGR